MHDNGMLPNIDIETLAETENYTIWRADEPDGEATYHVELGPVTAHFFTEEWTDFIQLIRDSAVEFAQLGEAGDDEDDNDDVEIELDWGSMLFSPDEWQEFLALIGQI